MGMAKGRRTPQTTLTTETVSESGKRSRRALFIFVELTGYAGCLSWGTHRVTRRMQRGFWLRAAPLTRAQSPRTRAFLVGFSMTPLLQSRTATIFMANSFTAAGLIFKPMESAG